MRGKILVLIIILNLLAVNASDVAYLLKNTRNPDYKFLDSFSELNLTVDLINFNQIKFSNLSSYKLVFVGNQRFDNPEYFKNNKYISLIANSFHLDDWGLSNDKISQMVNNQPLQILHNNITFTVYDRCCYSNNIGLPIYYLQALNKNENIKAYASTLVDNNDAVIGFIKKNKKLTNGLMTEKKNAFFGITETRFWTNDAKKLFKRTVELLLTNSLSETDVDNDGVTADKDCNDNNVNIRPDATDIPYDGIDQNCDNHDLTDVDNDGYESITIGGNDCNDNNASIHPNAVEVANNGIDENCDGHDLIIQEDLKNITNKTLGTEIEVVLYRNKDNKLMKDATYNLPPNSEFNNYEDFLISYNLCSTLETGYYDLVFVGKAKDKICSLNNDETQTRITIFIQGTGETRCERA